MPKLPSEIYQTFKDATAELANRPSGVSKPQLINDLNVTQGVANGLIKACGLIISHKDGRTYFYKPGVITATDDAATDDAATDDAATDDAATDDAATDDAATDDAAVVSITAAPEVIAATIPKTVRIEPEEDNETLEDKLAELDAQIIDTRQALRSAAAKAGKALGEYATHQALVDALRERMQALATERMNTP
jgi:hypothetical protein